MKKIFFFTAIAFLMLSSCKKESTTLSKDQALAKSQSQTNASTSGGAFTYHDVQRFNLDGLQIYNPCTNEIMTATTWRVVIETNGVYNGDRTLGNTHINSELKLVGESGIEYVAAGSNGNDQTTWFSDGTLITRFIRHYQILTAGGGNNVIFTQTYYVKVYADGTVIDIVDPVYELRCQ